jgi:hypothetical protein
VDSHHQVIPSWVLKFWITIVGARKWADLALMFTAKGLRKFPIEYFEPAQLAQARAWLAALRTTSARSKSRDVISGWSDADYAIREAEISDWPAR